MQEVNVLKNIIVNDMTIGETVEKEFESWTSRAISFVSTVTAVNIPTLLFIKITPDGSQRQTFVKN
jgi:hypothetical protein